MMNTNGKVGMVTSVTESVYSGVVSQMNNIATIDLNNLISKTNYILYAVAQSNLG